MILYIILGVFSLYVLAVVLALLTNRSLKKKEYQGIPWKECFYPSKHLSFFVGFVIGLIPQHILIQYSIRFLSKKCRDCQKSGECLNYFGKKTCGCHPYKKACSPWEKCINGVYGPIIWNKKKAWEYIEDANPDVIWNNQK